LITEAIRIECDDLGAKIGLNKFLSLAGGKNEGEKGGEKEFFHVRKIQDG